MPLRILSLSKAFVSLAILLCIVYCDPIFGQTRKLNNIYLKSALLQPVANASAWIDSVNSTNTSGDVQVLLQFSSLPTTAQKETLLLNGIRLLDHVPDNAYTAIVRLPFTGSISGVPLVSVTNIADEWKADRVVWTKVNSDLDAQVAVMVSFDGQVPEQEIRALVKSQGGAIEKDKLEAYAVYKVIIAAKSMSALAHDPRVKYISPIAKYAPVDAAAKATSRTNIIAHPVSLGGYGLLGDSVTVGVGDNVAGIYHIDMLDRVINYNPAVMQHHGVFTNGIIGSAGIVDPLAEGMAPHVRLIDHLYDNILQATGLMNQQYGMSITNNSYVTIEGDCSYSGTYDVYAQFADNLASQYPTVFHVFAAGNDGTLTCSPYPVAFGTVAGGYQAAKNVLVVTSTDKDLAIAYDASHGPVRDGRLKPELSAVGFNAYSCIDVTSYEFASGTSFASPHAAGAAALLTQRYKNLYGILPSSDVLKALMLASATDIGNVGPDYTFGYGSMNVQHAMQILDSGHYFTNTIVNGGQQNKVINVPANIGKLKIMLYWNDTAASPLSSKQLVNDLDLFVQAPDASAHLPLILDPDPDSVNNIAVPGADHLNNSEEVVIDDPAAGAYTISVTGYHVPSAAQHYVVAYDLESQGVKITNPVQATKVASGKTLNVYWDAPDVNGTFMLQYSTDSGTTWNQVAANIAATQRFYDWTPDTTISSGLCMLKLTRGSISDVSGTFIISPQPIVTLDTVQCPGYINFHWTPIANATGYQVLRKKGPYMHVIDTVLTNSYSLRVPVYDSMYYVAVSPIVNKLAGYRSLAVWRTPVDGSCAGFPIGDIAVDKTTLTNGRQFTSNQLTNADFMTVTLRNRYTSNTTNYSLAYNVNGGVWSKLFGPPVIPADSTVDVMLPGLQLGATGSYVIKVAVHNIGTPDPVSQNDTLIVHVTNIANPVLSLATPFFDGFDSMSVFSLSYDSIGISPNGHWDYATATDTGRLRTFVDDSITISGTRSISMDAYLTQPGDQNYFTGTFNLSAYDSARDEVRMEFDYILHGTPKTAAGNQVWVRGLDTKAWLNFFSYDETSYPGTLLHSGSLSVSDMMLQSRQNFSPSTQVRFGQNDTAVIAFRNYGNGVTLDNFLLYTVHNDVQLVSVVTPTNINCGLGSSAPLTVLVHNGVKQTQVNVVLNYQLDGGPINTDTLATLAGKDTVSFTFKELMDLTATGKHTLNIYLSDTADSYTKNDSILNYVFYNQPLITSFPYLENFESGPGSWFTLGLNDSWQYGTPASPKINKAASGTKAWKTNLTGNYNNLETSYLYSPCFDISKLKTPMISFSTAMDIENCGTTLCDAGYMEYSYDGLVWTRLGAYGQGYNWYDSTFDVWNTLGDTRWHVASMTLPASTQPIKLRFVLISDPGVTHEGMAIDDVHIFDLQYSIYAGTTPDHVPFTASGNNWLDVSSYNAIVASLNADGNNLAGLDVGVYNNYNYTNNNKTQYVFPRNFTVKAPKTSTDSLGIRLFVLDKEFQEMLTDSGCSSCSSLPVDVYSLGVSKYDNPSNTSLENGILSDNNGGSYTYYPSSVVKWVPYNNGYYAELSVKSFSEFWFNDGGPGHTFSVGDDYIVLDAQKISPQLARVTWVSNIDTFVSGYIVQRSMDRTNFTDLSAFTAVHQTPAQYVYVDTPSVRSGGVVYYRLHYALTTGDSLYSNVKQVDWTDADELITMYPNPTKGQINIKWTAALGESLQLLMVDETGRTVYQKNILATQWNNLTTLQTPEFASGIYFMKIIVGNRQYQKKIVYE